MASPLTEPLLAVLLSAVVPELSLPGPLVPMHLRRSALAEVRASELEQVLRLWPIPFPRRGNGR